MPAFQEDDSKIIKFIQEIKWKSFTKLYIIVKLIFYEIGSKYLKYIIDINITQYEISNRTNFKVL